MTKTIDFAKFETRAEEINNNISKYKDNYFGKAKAPACKGKNLKSKEIISPKVISESIEQIREDFKNSWDSCLELMLNAHEFSENAQSEREWLKNVLIKTVPNGKLNRGVTSIAFYRAAKPQAERTEKDDELAYLFGWCLEILQTVSLIADDIMDGSVTRRGKKCWYKEANVGMMAVNDFMMLECLVNETVKKYFGDQNEKKDNYYKLLKILQEIKFYTVIGQYMDTKFALDGNIHEFDMTKYSTIVKLKTSYFSFYAPIAAPMVFLGITDPEIVESVESIMLEIGEYFQIQDDYLDCFGDPKITGKIGTDIIDRKCNWLFVKAMELCNEKQKEELLKCYGIHCTNMENCVKELYKNLNIPGIFEEYEETTYLFLMKRINQLPSFIPKQPLRQALGLLYKREK